MSENTWTEIDAWFEQRLGKPDPVLDAAVEASVAGGLPNIQVAPNQGALLGMLAKLMGAFRILEIGTLGGYSTIWLARALPEGGRLVTLEAEKKHADVARANIARAGFSHVVDLRLGPALETLPSIEEEHLGPFDLVFIDADKANIPDYFRWALKLSRPGTLIVVDNVVRHGAIIDPKRIEPDVEGVRKLTEMLSAEPRVEALALQTVGSKGHDGLILARVRTPTT